MECVHRLNFEQKDLAININKQQSDIIEHFVQVGGKIILNDDINKSKLKHIDISKSYTRH